jgi:hypothetical protein
MTYLIYASIVQDLHVATLTTLISHERLRPKLPKMAEGSSSLYVANSLALTAHFGLLVHASPCLPRDARHLSQVPERQFTKEQALGRLRRFLDNAELNIMEKQHLYLLDYDLCFDEAAALRVWQPFLVSAAAQAIARRASRERSGQEAR